MDENAEMENVKFLGSFVDKPLNWVPHIDIHVVGFTSYYFFY